MKDTDKVMLGQPAFIEDSQAPWTDLVEEDYHVKVFADKYPVTNGHLLFVPKYNTVSVLMDCFESAMNDGIKRVHELRHLYRYQYNEFLLQRRSFLFAYTVFSKIAEFVIAHIVTGTVFS